MASNSRPPALIITTTVMSVLVILSTCGRFVSRKISGAGFWLDDWIVLVAAGGALAVNAITYILVADGEGKHATNLPPDATKNVLFHTYFLEVFCHFDVVIVKFAFLLLYGRIFARRTFRRVLWMTAAAIMAWGIASVTVLIFQCRPLRRAWNRELDGYCINLSKFLYGQSVPDVIFDVVLLLLPIAFIAQLQMGASQRWALSAVFLLGLFTVIASVVRLVVFTSLKDYDFPWNYTNADLWSILEVNIGIIVTCLMTCGPLLKRTLVKAHITSDSANAAFVKPGLVTIGSRGTARSRVNKKDMSGFTDLESTVPPAVINDSREGLTANAQLGQRGEDSFELDKIYVRQDIRVEERGADKNRWRNAALSPPEPPIVRHEGREY